MPGATPLSFESSRCDKREMGSTESRGPKTSGKPITGRYRAVMSLGREGLRRMAAWTQDDNEETVPPSTDEDREKKGSKRCAKSP